MDIKDKIQKNIDEVEEKYIDPLKGKVDEYSQKPLSWLEKNGQKAILITIIVIASICAVAVINMFF